MTTRALLIVLLLALLPGMAAAQNTPTPYDTALERIEEAARTNATQLDLSWLQLTELPPEIGQLTALQYLALSVNQLTELPPQVSQLSALQLLALNDNQLSTLPPEIGQLTNLHTLHLSGNQLSTLPLDISQLTALTWIDLQNNPLEFPPPDVAAQGVYAIRDYYSRPQPPHHLTLPFWFTLAGVIAGMGVLLRGAGVLVRRIG
ncbi:MAG: leucine-rich repeat domain-containing protein [Chloroflexota bacterium]